MNALVTGATGFVGSRLARSLLESGASRAPGATWTSRTTSCTRWGAARTGTSRSASGSRRTYADMLDRMAAALGTRPRPKLRVPFLSPRLSSLWIGLVTPVDVGIARPLIEGLRTETVVTDPSGAEPFGVAPLPFYEALRRALAEERE